MGNKGYQIHVPVTKYPGPDNFYIICDVCGKKIRRKEAIYIRDKFNFQNRLLVCRQDADKENQQTRPFKAREYKAPKLVRPRVLGPDANVNTSILPSAPVQLQAEADYLTGAINLFWIGPNDTGSSAISGYVIYVSSPQYSFQYVLDANTQSVATSYVDTINDPAGNYTYQVAAINAGGIGPKSNIAPYPVAKIAPDIDYFVLNAPNYPVLDITGNGLYFVLGEGTGV